jgi:hypothetical protein
VGFKCFFATGTLGLFLIGLLRWIGELWLAMTQAIYLFCTFITRCLAIIAKRLRRSAPGGDFGGGGGGVGDLGLLEDFEGDLGPTRVLVGVGVGDGVGDLGGVGDLVRFRLLRIISCLFDRLKRSFFERFFRAGLDLALRTRCASEISCDGLFFRTGGGGLFGCSFKPFSNRTTFWMLPL